MNLRKAFQVCLRSLVYVVTFIRVVAFGERVGRPVMIVDLLVAEDVSSRSFMLVVIPQEPFLPISEVRCLDIVLLVHLGEESGFMSCKIIVHDRRSAFL